MILMNQSCNIKHQDALEINIKILDQISHDIYKIDIELINACDTSINFWFMSCSWEESFLYSTDEIFLKHKECPKNHPHLESLMPDEKLMLKGILKNLKSDKDQNYILGFVLIKENEYSISEDFHWLINKKIEEKKDIIWSKTFSL